ncbi:MAG: U32 family peptidase C-terminal domain-containing protein, partial [Eubacterium sp.]|nr:U32 family peptidase C-terminal domain-containing protein [Eubacterium sp.]
HPEVTEVDPFYFEELRKVSHRNYTTGFFEHKTTAEDQNYGTSSYTRLYDFAGVVQSYDAATGRAVIVQRNKIAAGDEIEVMAAGVERGFYTQRAQDLLDEQDNPIEATPHAKMIYSMKMDHPVKPMDIIRKRVD